MGWSRDAGGANTAFAVNLHATLLRKPYVQNPLDPKFQQQDLYKYVGYLAKGYTVSKDGRTYTFALTDAKSAAGNTLTAEDVRWSFERKFKVPTSTAPGSMNPVITDPGSQIKVIDDKTVSFTLSKPGMGATFLAIMSDLLSLIYDSKLLKEHATSDDPYAIKWSQENPNYGFGAYEVNDFAVGEYATFTAREDYILGPPPTKTINVRIVPDAGTRATALERGDADAAEGLLPSDYAKLSASDKVTLPEIKTPNQFLMMPLITTKAPFNKAAVRQAMAYAIPYDQIIKSVYAGRASHTSSGFLLTNTPGHDGSGLPSYSYDPAKAKQILADAGVSGPVRFELTISAAEPESEVTAIQIQSAAKAAGFEITIKKRSAADFDEATSDHRVQANLERDWALTLTPAYELNLYTVPGSGLNKADWTNEEFRNLLVKGNEEADQFSAQAGKIWNKAERIYIDQAPIVFVAQVQPNVGLSSQVTGYAWRSDNNLDYAALRKQ